jgi:hypothetical protein
MNDLYIFFVFIYVQELVGGGVWFDDFVVST